MYSSAPAREIETMHSRAKPMSPHHFQVNTPSAFNQEGNTAATTTKKSPTSHLEGSSAAHADYYFKTAAALSNYYNARNIPPTAFLEEMHRRLGGPPSAPFEFSFFRPYHHSMPVTKPVPRYVSPTVGSTTYPDVATPVETADTLNGPKSFPAQTENTFNTRTSNGVKSAFSRFEGNAVDKSAPAVVDLEDVSAVTALLALGFGHSSSSLSVGSHSSSSVSSMSSKGSAAKPVARKQTARGKKKKTITKKKAKVVKKYSCTHPGCSYSSSRSGNLKVHIRSHSGERPYRCEHPNCSYASTQLSNLKIHQRTHTGIRPYACDVAGCKFASAQRSNLKAHQRRVHKTEFPKKQ